MTALGTLTAVAVLALCAVSAAMTYAVQRYGPIRTALRARDGAPDGGGATGGPGLRVDRAGPGAGSAAGSGPAGHREASRPEPSSRPPGRAAGPSSYEGSARLVMLVGVLAVSVAGVGWFTVPSGFFSDDFANFRLAQLNRLSLHYLVQPTSNHFAPGHVLGDWLVQHLFPFDFGAAQVLLLTGFAVLLLLFHRLLADLFGPGPGPLALTLLFGASVVHVAVLEWWAAGLDRVPATILSFLSVIAYLRFHRRRAPLALALSVVSLAAALLFYVKPVFVPLYLVLMRVLVLDPDRPVAEALRDTVSEWRVWCAYLVPIVPYLAAYVHQYGTGGVINAAPGGSAGRYLAVLWFKVAAPNLFGIYLSKGGSAPVVLAAGAVQLALVALVVWAVRRWRGAAWRALVFFAITAAVNALAVAFTKIGAGGYGPTDIAYALYYDVEISFLFLIAVGAVALPRARRRAADPRSRPAPAGRPGAPWGAGPPVLIAGGLACYLVVSFLGARAFSENHIGAGRRDHAYASRTRAALALVARAGHEVALVDRPVPGYVVPSFWGPYASTSQVFPVIDARVGFDADRPRLADLGDDGRVAPVTFASDAGGDAIRLMGTPALAFGRVEVDATDGRVCMRSAGDRAVVALTPPAPLAGTELALRLRYTVRRREVLTLAAEHGGGDATPATVRYVVAEGDQARVYALGTPALGRLVIGLPRGSRICLGEIRLGHLLPGP